MAGEPAPKYLQHSVIANASRSSFSYQHPGAVDETTICVVMLEQDGSTGTPAAPDGTWTHLSGSPFIGTGGNRVSVWWRRMSRDNRTKLTGNFTLTSDFCSSICAYYRGCSQSGDPQSVAATKQSVNGTSLVLPSITTLEDNCMLLGIGGEQDVGASHTMSWATPRVNASSFFLGEAVQAVAGASGTKTVTLSVSSAAAGFLLALKPGVEGQELPEITDDQFPHPPARIRV